MAAPLMRSAVPRPGSRALAAQPRRRRPGFCTSSSRSAAAPHAKPVAHYDPLVAPPLPPPPGLLLRLPPAAVHARPDRAAFGVTDLRWDVGRDDNSPDPNKAKLGKTLRILQERLPTLLQSPLPQEILAPNIALQLFPTTHPHLPTVSGRVAYNAALWTSPIAWNRVPIVGNVKLEILAERVTSEPLTFLPRRAGAIPEQLVVRWCEKPRPANGSIVRTLWGARGGGGGGGGGDPDKAFTGLFTFDFDAQGRILTHTIEQAQEGGDWERGVGAKFVGLTDWLLGGMKDPHNVPVPVFENLKKRREE